MTAMTAVLIPGSGDTPGKTTLALALARHFQRQGLKVGYFKPQFGSPSATPDADAVFARNVLRLSAPVETLAPYLGPVQVPQDKAAEVQEALTTAYAAAAAGMDVVVIESPGGLGDSQTEPLITLVADTLDAKVVPVVRFTQGLDGVQIATRLNRVKARTLGIVVNSVPRRVLPNVAATVGSVVEQRGFPVLGFLPEDRTLYGFSIGELAAHLNAAFLTGEQKQHGLIENILLQANPADPLSMYVDPKPNRMVIVRVDRPDLQLAAMDTEPRCLVLTGPGRVLPSNVNRAEDDGVPVLRVDLSTKEVIAAMDGLLPGIRLRQEDKLPRLDALAQAHLKLDALTAAVTATPAAAEADETATSA